MKINIGLIGAFVVVIGIAIGINWLLTIALVRIFPGLIGKEIWVFLATAIVLGYIDKLKKK